jgi:hypothetical protein
MTIELNDPDDTRHDDPYYTDHEVPFQLREWMDDALSDRDDSPKITWSEFTKEEPWPVLPTADTGEINIVRGTG